MQSGRKRIIFLSSLPTPSTILPAQRGHQFQKRQNQGDDEQACKRNNQDAKQRDNGGGENQRSAAAVFLQHVNAMPQGVRYAVVFLGQANQRLKPGREKQGVNGDERRQFYSLLGKSRRVTAFFVQRSVETKCMGGQTKRLVQRNMIFYGNQWFYPPSAIVLEHFAFEMLYGVLTQRAVLFSRKKGSLFMEGVYSYGTRPE